MSLSCASCAFLATEPLHTRAIDVTHRHTLAGLLIRPGKVDSSFALRNNARTWYIYAYAVYIRVRSRSIGMRATVARATRAMTTARPYPSETSWCGVTAKSVEV